MTENEKNTLRKLAACLAELAACPVENEKRALWYKHNALEETRPLVFCDPEIGWGEIIPASSLVCEGDTARIFELYLRKELFWAECMLDDRVVEARFCVPYVFTEDWGLQMRRIGGSDGVSYRIDAPIKDYSDTAGLHFPIITIDHDQIDMRYHTALEIFGDI